MKRLAQTLLYATIASLSVGASASTLRIETPVEGSVTTVSAAINCAAGQVCDVNVSDVFFDETFVAEPAPGWHFAGWKARQGGLCVAETGNCRVDASEFEDQTILNDPGVIQYLEPEFVVDRTTSGIALADSITAVQLGVSYDLDFYRNSTYNCGLTGNYSFMIINPGDGSADDEAPLWVYAHGGGFGYFDEQGNYPGLIFQDENTLNHEETFQDLQDHITTRVLDDQGQPEDHTLTRRVLEGYRLLVVALCDHDNYSGLGTPYTNNPLPNREVNGMQATMSAVEFTAANYPTTEVWAHGTSAGSTGVYNLAMSFAAEGIHLTGVIADHIVGAPRSLETMPPYFGQPGSLVDADVELEGYIEKVGFYMDYANGAYPEARVAGGFDEVPIFFLGGANDPFCHADFPAVPGAAALGLNNCEYVYDGIAQAVAAQPGSPHQVSVFNSGHVPSINRVNASNAVDGFISGVLASNPPAPFADTDGDGVVDSVDNCRAIANPDQTPSLQNPECGAACVVASCGGPICSNPEF